MCTGTEGLESFRNKALEMKGMHTATEAVQKYCNDDIFPCPMHSLDQVMMEGLEDLQLECGDHQLRC